MTDFSIQAGERIKRIRKAAKLTQEKLAEKAGLSVEYISRIERGVSQPSFKTLETLADVLNVDVKDLFDFKGPIFFMDKKHEAKLKKDYLEAISSAIKEMSALELEIVCNIVQRLAGKATKA